MQIACLLNIDGLSQSQKMEIVNCIMSDDKQNDATLKVTTMD